MQKILLKITLLMSIPMLASCTTQRTEQWSVHDPLRPVPPVVTPGPTNDAPPSDAIILFDGGDLSAWESCKDAGEPKWKVQDGYMEVASNTGSIQTRQGFGSSQLHIEWCVPEGMTQPGQKRSNSGVFLMGLYEVQVLDSYENVTYADGQAAAIYGQKPPLVNACRKPGMWQTYDIIFHAPQFDGDKVARPAVITVLHNGVLVQDCWEIEGMTRHKEKAYYKAHAGKLPLQIQDHKNPVRFRNIWIRPLQD